MTQPSFSLSAGSLRSSSANPVGAPVSFAVRRAMDTPADALEVVFGAPVSLRMGTTINLNLGLSREQSVFTGTVYMVRPAVRGIMVTALGATEPLLNLFTAQVFEKKTAGDVVQALARAAQVTTGTITAGPQFPIYAVDTRRSAYAHLRQLADRLGYELYTDASGKLMFHQPRAVGGARFTYGRDVINAVQMTRPASVGKITVGAESPASKEGDKTTHWLTANDKDFTGTAGSGKPERLLIDPAARTKDAAQTFATGQVKRGERRAALITLRLPGAPELDLGSAVTLSGDPPNLAAGGGYVCALTHTYSARTGFITTVTLAGSA